MATSAGPRHRSSGLGLLDRVVPTLGGSPAEVPQPPATPPGRPQVPAGPAGPGSQGQYGPWPVQPPGSAATRPRPRGQLAVRPQPDPVSPAWAVHAHRHGRWAVWSCRQVRNAPGGGARSSTGWPAAVLTRRREAARLPHYIKRAAPDLVVYPCQILADYADHDQLDPAQEGDGH